MVGYHVLMLLKGCRHSSKVKRVELNDRVVQYFPKTLLDSIEKTFFLETPEGYLALQKIALSEEMSSVPDHLSDL